MADFEVSLRSHIAWRRAEIEEFL